jgi:nucleoside 2-deoxyribosyltransferase
MRIFLAAPLFNEAERVFNKEVAAKLRAEGFEVWLAQEHEFIKGSDVEEKRLIFEEDLDALKKSNIIIAVLDGVDVDTGVAFEMGFAHANGKPIIGLKTDHRVFSRVEAVNLMLEAPLTIMCESLGETIKFLRSQKKNLET